jgi:hypothetical protein
MAGAGSDAGMTDQLPPPPASSARPAGTVAVANDRAFKTIGDFRRGNGRAIRASCRQFAMLCRRLDLFSETVIAIDGSRFKAVNTRDKNYTHGAIERRMEQVEAVSYATYRHWTRPIGKRARSSKPNRFG